MIITLQIATARINLFPARKRYKATEVMRPGAEMVTETLRYLGNVGFPVAEYRNKEKSIFRILNSTHRVYVITDLLAKTNRRKQNKEQLEESFHHQRGTEAYEKQGKNPT